MLAKTTWHKSDMVPAEQLESVIDRTDAVRLDWQILNIDPIGNLDMLGLPPIDISGKFRHLVVTLLDINGDDIAALHGLAARKGYETEPLEVGARDSYLRAYVMRANSDGALRARARHPYICGKAVPISDTIRRYAHSALPGYIALLQQNNVPYCVPFQTRFRC